LPCVSHTKRPSPCPKIAPKSRPKFPSPGPIQPHYGIPNISGRKTAAELSCCQAAGKASRFEQGAEVRPDAPRYAPGTVPETYLQSCTPHPHGTWRSGGRGTSAHAPRLLPAKSRKGSFQVAETTTKPGTWGFGCRPGTRGTQNVMRKWAML
jgi:hypothetical protein